MDAGRYVEMLWLFSIVITGFIMIVAICSFMVLMYRMVSESGLFAVVA